MQLQTTEATILHIDSPCTNPQQFPRQLPPLQNIIKFDSAHRKQKFEDDWSDISPTLIEYAGVSPDSTSPTSSPSQPSGTYMPLLSHSFEDLHFRNPYSDSVHSDVAMLSSSGGWGSNSQYSSGTSSYPSSTSSTQSFYSSRPPIVTPSRNQQSLPSLTEMNLNNTPGYSSRPSHVHSYPRHHLGSSSSTSPYFGQTNDSLSMAYASKPHLGSSYSNTYSSFSPRSSYTHNPPYTPTMESYSSTIDPYAYSNGHPWSSSLPYPPNYANISDSSSSGGRRRRGNLPKHVTDILRAWFHEHLDHPYPTDEDKQMLILRTNLSISQISNWFINARRRHWPQLKAERERAMQVQGVGVGAGYKGALGKS